MSQAGVMRTTELYKKLTVALVGIGSAELTDDNIEYRLRYFSAVELRKLQAQGVVGDHCVFFDINGKVCGDKINAKRIGITYEEMLKVRRRIAVAIGHSKIKAILGAARAGLFNEFVTDERDSRRFLILLRAGLEKVPGSVASKSAKSKKYLLRGNLWIKFLKRVM